MLTLCSITISGIRHSRLRPCKNSDVQTACGISTYFAPQTYRWLGLLFAVLALGARFQATLKAQDSSDPSMERDPALSLYSARMHLYREKIVQCLVLANYTKCKRV
jgi:hypothetical protein